MSYFEVKNSVAFVTGTNKKSGIGRAIVAALLDAGASKVYATARRAEQVDDLVAAWEGRVVAVPLDVTDEAAVALLGDRYRDVDLLVNNAGFFAGSSALGNVGSADSEWAVNYRAPLLITQSFAPVLASHAPRGFGMRSAIVNLNSIVSFFSFPLGATYSASKAASHSLTQAQRRELADSLVIGVYPGPIDTAMAETLPMDKVPPSVVAEAIVGALATGTEDVFPDAAAREMYAGYRRDNKALEAQMTALSNATS